MGLQRGCLARYGRTNRMEWFDFAPELADSLVRGRAVVIQSTRGEELGEVLMISGAPNSVRHENPVSDHEATSFQSRLVRIAEEEDLDRARHAEAIRRSRFDECRHLVADGRWPVEIVDVELLLDGRTTVVGLFKADDFDLTALRAQFRDWFDFEVILAPAGGENEAAILIPADPSLLKAASSGGCGSGGCSCGSSGGGCGTTAKIAEPKSSKRSEAIPV